MTFWRLFDDHLVVIRRGSLKLLNLRDLYLVMKLGLSLRLNLHQILLELLRLFLSLFDLSRYLERRRQFRYGLGLLFSWLSLLLCLERLALLGDWLGWHLLRLEELHLIRLRSWLL